MATSDVGVRFDLLAELFDPVTLIMAPPRSCSTALARVFWSLSSYRFYSHEPFEVAYYEGADLERVAALLANPPKITNLDPSSQEKSSARGLLIKEMTFQVGADFPLLLRLATGPVIFLIRDPRLCVVSRMRVLSRHGRQPIFDPAESGWAQLARQIEEALCRKVPYVVVDAHSFRSDPRRVVSELAEIFGFTYSDRLLKWRSSDIGSLSAMHHGLDDPFYDRVLRSRGIEPLMEQVPTLREIPEERGLRQHVEEALEIFNELQSVAI